MDCTLKIACRFSKPLSMLSRCSFSSLLGHKTNTSVQVLENQAHLYVISFFLQLTLWLKNKTVAHERKKIISMYRFSDNHKATELCHTLVTNMGGRPVSPGTRRDFIFILRKGHVGMHMHRNLNAMPHSNVNKSNMSRIKNLL